MTHLPQTPAEIEAQRKARIREQKRAWIAAKRERERVAKYGTADIGALRSIVALQLPKEQRIARSKKAVQAREAKRGQNQ